MNGIGLDGGQFFIYLICLLIIVAFGWSQWGKLLDALEARRTAIRKTHENAAAAEEQLANAQRDSEQLVKEARKEAGKIAEDAQTKADQQTTQIIDDAKKQAQGIVDKAREDAKNQLDDVLAEARFHITELSIAAAEKLIGDTLNQDQSRMLINDFFAHVPEGVHDLGEGVTVTSAVPLSENEKADIERCIGAVNVVFNVNPSILGGIIITYNNGRSVNSIDGSMATKLAALKSSMLR